MCAPGYNISRLTSTPILLSLPRTPIKEILKTETPELRTIDQSILLLQVAFGGESHALATSHGHRTRLEGSLTCSTYWRLQK